MISMQKRSSSNRMAPKPPLSRWISTTVRESLSRPQTDRRTVRHRAGTRDDFGDAHASGPVIRRDNLMDKLTGVREPLAVEFDNGLPALIARAVAEANAGSFPRELPPRWVARKA